MDSFESEVERVAALYRRSGAAMLLKRYEPYRITGRLAHGGFRGVHLKKSGPDYSLWLPDGRSGLIEVKSGTRPTLDPLQVAMLAQTLNWGYLSLVLYRSPSAEWYLIHYRDWAPCKGRSPSFITTNGIPLGETPDFLEHL